VFEMFGTQIPLVSVSDTVPDVAVVHGSGFVLHHLKSKLSLGSFEKTQCLFLICLSHIVTYLNRTSIMCS